LSYSVKDWSEYQHYKDRTSPPWIKLHKKLLDDPDFHDLSGEAVKALMMIWLVASENDGKLPDIKKLAFRLRIDSKVLAKMLQGELSHWIICHDSKALAECYQDDSLEEKRVEEKRGEEKQDARPDPESSPIPLPHTSLPSEWRAWAVTELGWSNNIIEDVWASFSEYWQNPRVKNRKKINWFAAWRTWCRKERIPASRGFTPPTSRQARENVRTL
jgi:hypothetical protein